jgi:murein DD-endopeptidase MepM/ murein hydrolase activator NlpD
VIARIASIMLVCVTGLSYLGYRQLRNTPASPTTLHAPIPAPIGYDLRNDRERWAHDLATRLGNPQPSADIVSLIVAWQTEENTTAAFNPLATSQDMPGATLFNSSKVKNYPDYQTGIEATAITLSYSYAGYAEILVGLQTNDPDLAIAGLTASPWAEEPGYGDRIRALYQPTSTQRKCPYTSTMAIGDNSSFYSTGSGYWSGQYGGMHLGVDFIGNAGDPVYAPFDMHIESIGEYTDLGRLCKNIQARFADGTLYYAGHLIDVYVSAGQFVAACEVIATLGATAGPHVHVKLAGSNAPIPCESSPPGEYGCIDPIEYWESH